MATIASATFLTDTITFVRDKLDANVTDPISGSRAGRDRFVMTSYPQRTVKYPIITVVDSGISDERRLGLQSEATFMVYNVEIRIWARNVKERDSLTQEVYTFLRTNQFDGPPLTDGASVGFGLHDFALVGATNVNDFNGDASVRSKVLEFRYKAVIT